MNSIRRIASIVGIAAFLCVVATAGAAGHSNGHGKGSGIIGSGAGIIGSGAGIIGSGSGRKR